MKSEELLSTSEKQYIYLLSFGCQMNKLDSELILGKLLESGFILTEEPEKADIIIINTCSVRQQAENRVWSYLGYYAKLKKKNPRLIIGVVGCMAQKEKAQILKRMPHVDIVCGTSQFFEIPSLVKKRREERKAVVSTEWMEHIKFERNISSRPLKHQAFISVMRGCNKVCSYCVVPFVRGPERSRPPEEIVEEARRLVEDGVKEITLLGQTINSYGSNLESDVSLASLLYLLSKIEGLLRIRFVTSYPQAMTNELLDAMRDIPQVCPYLHIPAQSGSNPVLERMRRGYTREEYEECVHQAQEKVPNIEISGDFIVGFPGETEEDHQKSIDLMEKVQYINCYIFKYSSRPRTSASRIKDDIPDDIKRKRNQELLALQEKVSEKRNQYWKGRVVEVLVEGVSKLDTENLTGRSPENHIVAFPGDPALAGQILPVFIEETTPLTLLGKLVNPSCDRPQNELLHQDDNSE